MSIARTQVDQENPEGRKPWAVNQDGVPVLEPQSHVSVEIPTDPKRLPHGEIKVYNRDPEVAMATVEAHIARLVVAMDLLVAARQRWIRGE